MKDKWKKNERQMKEDKWQKQNGSQTKDKCKTNDKNRMEDKWKTNEKANDKNGMEDEWKTNEDEMNRRKKLFKPPEIETQIRLPTRFYFYGNYIANLLTFTI